MVVLYKYLELFEDGKLKGEIFTQYPVSDILESCCIVGTLKKDEAEIDNGIIRYGDTNYGLIFTDKIVNSLDDIFKLWNKRKKNMAGWISRSSFHTGMIGCEYAKPSSDDWVFIEKKRFSEREIKKISKKETVDGFSKILEEYIGDELVSESFKLSDGTILKFVRDEIGFKKEDRGLILKEYDFEVFNELIDLWKCRRSIYG
jgi:hypothetical protein